MQLDPLVELWPWVIARDPRDGHVRQIFFPFAAYLIELQIIIQQRGEPVQGLARLYLCIKHPGLVRPGEITDSCQCNRKPSHLRESAEESAKFRNPRKGEGADELRRNVQLRYVAPV